jgi:uncharacterized lipoprotein YmbA
MARIFFREWYIPLLFLALLCAGCAGSVPCRFYQLSSLKGENAASYGNSRGQRVVVAVGPLRIPDYLDRPQIVTRSGANELRLAEFDRWAGSLERDTVRVLAEDLSVLLPADRYVVIPWISTWEGAEPSTYRIEVNIVRFEETAGGSVRLEAQWAVFHREKGLLLHRESVISEEVHGAGYGAVVAALSNALAGLSKDITNAVMSP